MISLRFRKALYPPPDWTTHSTEMLAYTQIETARLRSERLLERGDSESLRAIHRDLGLAGYYASADLSSALRIRCLEIARKECTDTSGYDLVPTLIGISEGTTAACEAIAKVLSQTHEDHMHMALPYVMSAAESLDEQLAGLGQSQPLTSA